MKHALVNRALRLLLLACLPAAPVLASAQQVVPPLNDPANLAGERVSAPALADDLPIDHGAAALEQLLRKLRTRASMMLIVAHPDDEDGGLLTYESRGAGARVAMLTLTRGEGGQNLMSGDFDDALGLIRTQELLAEDRYTGVDQMFGTEVDFGFSKTKEEAFAKWTHDRVLYDAVRAVRLYRPLVLASVFVGGPTDGHGHHQVAGEITQEVFKAAADPKVFPEMVADGLLPWAPLKVYARVPFSRVTAEGMFDYATGRTIPPRFENYISGVVTSTPPNATVVIREGDKPGIMAFHGLSYVQWARQGLALQKSQIGAKAYLASAGVYDASYALMGSRLDCKISYSSKTRCSMLAKPGWIPAAALPTREDTLFDGIDTSLSGIADLAPDAPSTLRTELAAIDARIAAAQTMYDPARLATAADPLHDALKMLDILSGEVNASALQTTQRYSVLHELRVKRVELNDALVLALGIEMTGTVPAPDLVVPGTTFHVEANFSAWSPSLAPCQTVCSLQVAAGQGSVLVGGIFPPPVAATGGRTNVFPVAVAAKAQPTQPYFHRPSVEQPFYNVDQPALRNAPQAPPPISLNVDVMYEGTRLDVVRSVSAAPAHAGEVLQPAVIVPAYSAAISPARAVFPGVSPERKRGGTPSSRPRAVPVAVPFTVTIKTNLTESSPEVSVKDDLQEVISGPQKPFRLDKLGAQQTEAFTVEKELGLTSRVHVIARTPSAEAPDPASDPLKRNIPAPKVLVSDSGSLGYRAVGYPGLTTTNLYRVAMLNVVPVDMTTAPNLRVGYLAGTGDDVPAFLTALGVRPVMLSPVDVTSQGLAGFDEIILGVRAYAAHPELSGAGSKPLLDYARSGGVVVVQYNSGGFNPASAPYPYELPGDSAYNVVEEEQPVRIVAPNTPLLNWPNKLTPVDFNGWVEERGHGFASTWAPEYQPLLEMHDIGQDPQRGGLLVAPVGKGAYIYCALALYRQLPEAVPGAYRLFANLLSYAKNPGRSSAATGAAGASH